MLPFNSTLNISIQCSSMIAARPAGIGLEHHTVETRHLAAIIPNELHRDVALRRHHVHLLRSRRHSRPYRDHGHIIFDHCVSELWMVCLSACVSISNFNFNFCVSQSSISNCVSEMPENLNSVSKISTFVSGTWIVCLKSQLVCEISQNLNLRLWNLKLCVKLCVWNAMFLFGKRELCVWNIKLCLKCLKISVFVSELWILCLKCLKISICVSETSVCVSEISNSVSLIWIVCLKSWICHFYNMCSFNSINFNLICVSETLNMSLLYII